VRGKFSYNTNHFPIENFYLLKIEQDTDGQFVRKIQSTIFTDHKDAYYTECHMQPLQ
jgi:branched-chain amino acid transport system substrate-binding protein